MNDLISIETGEITQFDPQKTKRVDAKADAVIDYARTLRDWPLLEQAAEVKIEQQREFVMWWDDSVAHPGQPKKNSPRSALILCGEAESLTGITHQQVSKWRKRLKDPAKYLALICGAAWKRAMGELVGSETASRYARRMWRRSWPTQGNRRHTTRGKRKGEYLNLIREI